MVILGALLAPGMAASSPGISPPGHMTRAEFQALSHLLAKTAVSGLSPEAPCSAVVGAGLHTPGESMECTAPTHRTATEDEEPGTDPQDDSAMSLRALATVETPTGLIDTAALPGSGGDAYVVVHSNGAVTSLTANGDVVWNHPSRSFTDATGRSPMPPFSPIPPLVLMGIDPIDPFNQAGEHPFAVGDLTGDGAADVAVAHHFYATFGIKGDAGTMVSVLDGTTGDFVWSHMYPGFVSNVLVSGEALIVAAETGDPRPSGAGSIGQQGGRSNLDAWKFSQSPGGTNVSRSWSLSTGAAWARWLALEPAGDNRFTAAWSATPVGGSATVRGHVLLASADTGTPTWSVETPGYPRFLRYDPERAQIVALEENDPLASSQLGYSLVGRSLTGGSTVTTLAQENAIALSFETGNIDGAAGSEWVVGDLSTTPNVSACPNQDMCIATGVVFDAGRVTSFDPGTGLSEWTQSRNIGAGPGARIATPQPYGLMLDTDGGSAVVVVASFMPGADDTELEGLNGATGSQEWATRAPNQLFPVFLSPYERNGKTLVMGASSRPNIYGGGDGMLNYYATSTMPVVPVDTTTPYQVVSAFDPDTGDREIRTPLLGEVYAVVGSDVNGDGTTDLIVGGESGGLFALDGSHLTDESPAVLWHTALDGPVHQIELTDFDGDGQQELIVAATSEVAVLAAPTGALRYELSYPNDFVWTLTVDDLNGDASPDIMVPTTSLSAYKGSDGSPLWTYRPTGAVTPYFSNAVVAAGNKVAVQYLEEAPANGNGVISVPPGNQTALALDGSNGTVLWSHSPPNPNGAPDLWNGVVAGTDVPGVAGTAAAFVSDRNTNGWTPGIDVYDLASGTLAYSGVDDQPGSNFGALLVPGEGIEAYSYPASLLVDPQGPHRNLDGRFPTDMTRASFGPFGVRSLAAVWPNAVQILSEDAFGVEQSTPVGYWFGFNVGRLHAQDLNGDGSDEIIATSFDWDGYSTAKLPEGRFSLSQDATAHGFAVLEAVSG